MWINIIDPHHDNCKLSNTNRKDVITTVHTASFIFGLIIGSLATRIIQELIKILDY